jgi:RimJ/RimL family protein N-acetyltransferase
MSAQNVNSKANQWVGRRVQLRPIMPTDYPYLYDLSNQAGSQATWRHRGHAISPEQFPSVLWGSVLTQFLIVSRQSCRPCGLVVGYDADLRNGTVRIAMILDSTVQGRGWPFEAGALLIEHLFQNWPLRKIYAEALSPVAQSIAGGIDRLFTEEGRLIQHEFVSGEWQDLHTFALYREQWQAERGRFWGRIVEGGAGRADEASSSQVR